jgi:hypothetical protein
MNIKNLKEQLANVLSSNIDLQGKIDQATQLLGNAGVPQESINRAQEVIANNGGIEQVLSTIQNTGGWGEMLGGFATDMAIEQATGGFMDQIGSFFGGEEGQDGE